jgi:hypothetical protein
MACLRKQAWGEMMNQERHRNRVLFLLLCSALLAASANAQRSSETALKKAVNHSTYDLSREQSLQGTVVSFTPNSTTPPIGAHVVVQTSAGTSVDVVLGSAGLLKAGHMIIAPGDSIRIIGETVPYGNGTIFVARLVQEGTQIVALRSTTGMPLSGPRNNSAVSSNARPGGAR